MENIPDSDPHMKGVEKAVDDLEKTIVLSTIVLNLTFIRQELNNLVQLKKSDWTKARQLFLETQKTFDDQKKEFDSLFGDDINKRKLSHEELQRLSQPNNKKTRDDMINIAYTILSQYDKILHPK